MLVHYTVKESAIYSRGAGAVCMSVNESAKGLRHVWSKTTFSGAVYTCTKIQILRRQSFSIGQQLTVDHSCDIKRHSLRHKATNLQP